VRLAPALATVPPALSRKRHCYEPKRAVALVIADVLCCGADNLKIQTNPNQRQLSGGVAHEALINDWRASFMGLLPPIPVALALHRDIVWVLVELFSGGT
jgi:hypothetical protein